MNEGTSGGFTSLFGAEPAPPAQQAPPPAAPVQAAPQQPVAQAAPQQPPAEQQPVAQAPAPTQEDKDFLSLLAPEQQQPVAWSDDAKKVFEATYGQADPIAFKQQLEAERAEITLLRQKNEQSEGVVNLLNRIEQQHPAIAAAIAKAAEGKDPFEYLSSLPNPSVLGKASKDLPEHFLLETYQRERFTDEELKAIKTGDYSDLSVSKEDVQAKAKYHLGTAQAMHDERNQKHMASLQQQEQQSKQQREAVDKSITEALAQANNDPAVRRHIDAAVIEKFRKGTLFNGAVFNEDGTWSKSALSNFVKGTRYDVDIKRAYEAGLNSAKQRSLVEETLRMPDRFAPNSGGSAPPQQRPAANQNGTFIGIDTFMSNEGMPQQRN